MKGRSTPKLGSCTPQRPRHRLPGMQRGCTQHTVPLLVGGWRMQVSSHREHEAGGGERCLLWASGGGGESCNEFMARGGCRISHLPIHPHRALCQHDRTSHENERRDKQRPEELRAKAGARGGWVKGGRGGSRTGVAANMNRSGTDFDPKASTQASTYLRLPLWPLCRALRRTPHRCPLATRVCRVLF